jgi:hypothetical protein
LPPPSLPLLPTRLTFSQRALPLSLVSLFPLSLSHQRVGKW